MAAIFPVEEADLALHAALTTSAHGGVVASSDVRLATVNVKAYGAKGDGSTDDTSAINAAITAAASGGKVYFPEGTYITQGGHTTAGKMLTFEGAGQWSSVLYLKNGSNADLLTVDTAYSVVRDMGFDGNYPSNLSAGNGIKVTSFKCALQNLKIRNARGHGIWIVGASSGAPAHACRLTNLTVGGTGESCQGSGIVVDSFAYDLEATNVWVGASVAANLLINSAEQNWKGCHFWGGTAEGVKVTAGDHCRWSACYFETNGSHGVSVNGAKGHMFSSCHFWGNIGHGCYAFNAPETVWSGCTFTDNSNGVFNQDGIKGDGTSTDCVVAGSYFGIENDGGITSHQKWGVETIASCDRWTITGNSFRASKHASGATSLIGSSNHMLGNDDGSAPPVYVLTGDARLSDARTDVRDYLANSSNPYRETFPRMGSPVVTMAAFSTGVLNLAAISLVKGDIISSLWFFSGTTALTMGSNADGHCWAALYDTTKTLVAQSTDAPSATWAASNWKQFTLASPAPYTVPASGIYYVGLMIAIGTGGTPAMPTLRGAEMSSTNFSGGSTASGPTGMVPLAATNGSSLGASAPAGPIALANSSHCMYVATN